MDIFDADNSHINNSCSAYSNGSCYCYNPLPNEFKCSVLAIISVGSLVGLVQWILIVDHFELFEKITSRTRKCIKFVISVVAFLTWTFWSNYFMEKYIFRIERTYMRWRLTFFFIGCLSLSFSICFSRKNFYLISMLMISGWSIIFSNLPLTVAGMLPEDRVLRLISPDYAFFQFLSLSASFAHVYILKNWERNTKQKKILYTMFKIFSFVWSATNFREYMKCIYDYIYHKGFHFWADLNLAHTKMLLFYSTFFVFGSLLLSWFHNYGQNVADMSHIILCYITFHHIIYFFRVTIIYEEFSWAILDMAEILLGILILFIGVWFVLYTHYEEPDTSAANSTAPPLANIAEIMNESS